MKNKFVKESNFMVLVSIENKPYVSDPEGETILRDLVLKKGYSTVQSIRTAKALKITVKARNSKRAEKIVRELCDELRIFNPVVSNCTVKVERRVPT